MVQLRKQSFWPSQVSIAKGTAPWYRLHSEMVQLIEIGLDPSDKLPGAATLAKTAIEHAHQMVPCIKTLAIPIRTIFFAQIGNNFARNKRKKLGKNRLSG